MKINPGGSGKILIEIEPGDNRDKIMQYLEALEWLINGEKCRAKEGYQERVCRR